MVYSFLPEEEAAKTWNLDSLYADLTLQKKELFNKEHLTSFEKKSLCALLCRLNIECIARVVNRTVNSVRVELSNGLYQYIKELTGEPRIIWSKVADWLEPHYHKKKSVPSTLCPSILLELNSTCGAASIVASIEEQMLKRLNSTANSSKHIYTSEEVKALINLGDTRFRNKSYIEAIKNYKESLEIDPWCMGVFNKIATCYDAMQLYSEVEIICDFVLSQPTRNAIKIPAYNLKGGALHERCLQEYNDLYVRSAIYCYRRALSISLDRDTLIAWNLIDLLLAMSQHNAAYIQTAKLESQNFIKIASNHRSNFKKNQAKILKDANKAINRLEASEQVWWRKNFLLDL